jgi:hypothetical protein
MRVILLLALIPFLGCKKRVAADTGFRLTASKVAVATKAGQGSGSHRIVDLWLYVNGQFQGAYPIDNAMPIISNGYNAHIDIFAGIRNDGLSTRRNYWKCYSPISFDTIAPSGSDISRDLNFKYSDAVTFAWVEGFNTTTGYSIKKTPGSDTTFKVVTGDAAFEDRSIEVGLTGNAMLAQIESSQTFTLPSANAEVYLEFNYKCDAEFSMGLIDDLNAMRPVISLSAKSTWNKTYISLADAINRSVSSNFKVYFRMVKTDNSINSKFLLDNLKIVYLP